jgi:hypothetical protein
MTRLIACALALGLVTGLTGWADDKWQPPTAPDGWKYVLSKDGTYEALFPKEAGRSGTQESNRRIGGVSVKLLGNYSITRDKTRYEVVSGTIGGRSTTAPDPKEAFDAIGQSIKEDGSKFETKDATLLGGPAREFRITGDKTSTRMLVTLQKNRLYILAVEAPEAAALESDKANTFLQSLVLIPKEAQQAAAKAQAAKQEESNKEAMEKYGFKWTLKLDEMTPPIAPVSGRVCGAEFKPDSVTLRAGGQLDFRQGERGVPDGQVIIFLNLKPNESVENRTFEINPAQRTPGLKPSIHLAGKPADARVPKRDIATDKYALKLTFEAKAADGTIPGTIYLCTSDSARSFIAGKFDVKTK